MECYRGKTRTGNDQFIMRDGLVCRALHGEEVVPDYGDLRNDLLTLHHDSPLAGGLGLYCISRALSKWSYWKGLHHDFRAHI